MLCFISFYSINSFVEFKGYLMQISKLNNGYLTFIFIVVLKKSIQISEI